MPHYFAAIEAGGTKFNCLVASGPDDLIAEKRFSTIDPETTLRQVSDWLLIQAQDYPLEAVGIGSFGPVDLDQASPTYGYITSTPKPGWRYAPFLPFIQEALHLPVAFETDVTVAALGEGAWGAAQGLQDYIYYTIGTGIGAGIIVNGQPVHGILHPEIGHMLLPHDLQKDPFRGNCPYHVDCFEGLATGPAMEKRWGAKAETLPVDHPAWALESEYIAAALHNTILAFAPQRIILGGGVMQQSQMFPLIRRRVVDLLGGYFQSPIVLEEIDKYITPPALGSRAGVLGALWLAMQIKGENGC
ncbi:MAG TPA: ROK family protein [Longilinea sp.]|nr:ROK family protein [Longilinea sp.]